LDCAPAIDEILPIAFGTLANPQAVALAAPGRDALTYGELARHIEGLRATLLDAGIRPGGVVALALPSGPEFIAAFLAVSSIGACAPLDPALTEPECRAHLTRLGAQALISEDGTPAAAAACDLGIGVLAVRSVPGDAAGVFSLSPSGRVAPDGRNTDAALLLHTSATTGASKLVPLTRANLRAMALHDARALGLTATDRFLGLMPLVHLHGISAALTQLSCGGSVVATAGFDSANFLAWLAEFRPTWFSSSPTIHRVILALARENPDAFRAAPLRLIRSTGAGLDPALLAALEEATGIPVLEGYGLTETGGVARSTLVARRPGSVGRSSGLEIAILEDGEIAVRGPSVASGYLDNPEATQAAFRDGWFHTGDLGRLDGDGFLFLTGRLKEMINRGGEKIVPEEVDRALAEHPAVAEAVAFAVPHRTLGEEVAAAVVLRTGATVTEAELRRFLAARLAAFKRPRRIAFVDRIPRGPTGKPKRAVLAEQLRDEATRHEPAALAE
jgi:acyl-CoA synthetase (AMP-forming)/AMP-acid ligase II